MPVLQLLRDIDKKFAWSFLGVLLAIIFGVVGIYSGFFLEKKTNLKYEVISNTAVLDVHEKVSNLDILYAGNSIKETGQTLQVITLQVINDGQVDILKTFYDENDPLGFLIVNGSIVENPQLLFASNEYLAKTIQYNVVSAQKVVFSHVIIDRGESFTLKILVLHNEGSIPDISPVGKVAGVKNISVTHPFRERTEESFWRRAFGGNIFVQASRLVLCNRSYLINAFACRTFSAWQEQHNRSNFLSTNFAL